MVKLDQSSKKLVKYTLAKHYPPYGMTIFLQKICGIVYSYTSKIVLLHGSFTNILVGAESCICVLKKEFSTVLALPFAYTDSGVYSLCGNRQSLVDCTTL